MKRDCVLTAFAVISAAFAASPALAQTYSTPVSMTCPTGIDDARMLITMLENVDGEGLVTVGFNCGSAAQSMNQSNKAGVTTTAKVGAVSYVIDILLPVEQAGRCEGTVATPAGISCAGKVAVKRGLPTVKVKVSRSN